jgi:uncharacterized LabA/DUF88 family protein
VRRVAAARDLARLLAERHGRIPRAAWEIVLDGLCTDTDLRRLVGRHLRAVPNGPLPRARTDMIDALVPPPALPRDQLREFAEDLLRIAPPDPPPETREEAARLLDAALSPEETARILWACLCGHDEAVADAAAEHARRIAETPPPRMVLSVDELADLLAERLLPALRDGLRHRDHSSRALDRLEQARADIHAVRDDTRAIAARIERALRALESARQAPTAAPAPPGPGAVADAVRRALEPLLTAPPPWASDALRRIDRAEEMIREIASQAAGVPTPQAQREAWRLAHPGAPLRIALVADLENLTSSARDWRGRRVNFAALRERLGRGGEIVSAAAFAVETPGQGGFLAALRHAGWEPFVRPTTVSGGRPKANWDVGITLHVVGIAPHIDLLGLATGDGDFADLLQWLREQGVRTRVAAVPEDASSKLRVWADEFIPVVDDLLIAPDPDSRESARPASAAP